jgi:hypothetical protein
VGRNHGENASAEKREKKISGRKRKGRVKKGRRRKIKMELKKEKILDKEMSRQTTEEARKWRN